MTNTRESQQIHDANINRALWREVNAQYTDQQADLKWAQPEITWGIFDRAESEVEVLGDVAGQRVVELGCGTAYFSAWLARLGANPTGVDLSSEQLATARSLQQVHDIKFPLIEADATDVPLKDGAFDLAVSEYGASLWCDLDAWVSEAARLLRPGGRLVFLTTSVLVTMAVPDDAGVARSRLARSQRDIRRIHWPGGGVEFHPGHGEIISALRRHGFEIESLLELFAPDSAESHEYYEIADPDWASKWPAEDLWSARRIW